MKKLTIRQHLRIHSGLLIAAFVLALISYIIAQGEPASMRLPVTMWLALACVIVSIVWRMLFIQCPHCGDKLLGSRVIPKFCPNCGKELNIDTDIPTTEGE